MRETMTLTQILEVLKSGAPLRPQSDDRAAKLGGDRQWVIEQLELLNSATKESTVPQRS